MLRGGPSRAPLEHTHTHFFTAFSLTFKHMHADRDTLKPFPVCPGEDNTYLSLRHDVEVVAVGGEGHVSQDGAAVLDDRYRLILDAAVRRPVDANLRNTEHRSGQRRLFIAA